MVKEKYYVIFSRDVSGSQVVVARRQFNPDAASDGVSYRGKSHTIDLKKPIYRENGKFYYMVDMEAGQKPLGEGKEPPVSPKLMDAIMRKEVAKQLVMGLEGMGNWKFVLFVALIVLAAGLLGGFVLGQVIPLNSPPPTNDTFQQIIGW